MKKLLVIIPDRLSAIVSKGEVVEGYYNQGHLFGEVHIMTVINDSLAKEQRKQVQKMVGPAKLYIYNLPKLNYFITLLNIRFLTKLFTKRLTSLGQRIKPDLIRCYGNHSTAYLGFLIKKRLNIPLIVSIHCMPEYDKRNLLEHTKSFLKKIVLKARFFFQSRMERFVNARADELIAVYKSAQTYLENYQGQNINLIYNVVNKNIVKKKNFQLHDPVRLITIGNQTWGVKDQTNIILALKNIPAQLDIIGQGNLNQHLKEIVKKESLQRKVNFVTTLQNNKIAQMLHQYDIYVFHTFAPELSKCIIEAMLAELPVIHNFRRPDCKKDLPDDCILEVEDNVAGYEQGLKKLISDKRFRQNIAEKAYVFAKANLAPEIMEKKIVNLYKKCLGS